ncbi:MAG TPA: hypothetical protein VN231_10825, partial [Allosphingosinicella sp.]|nr:hypothetical protein [Allosphingosinicella sp.]
MTVTTLALHRLPLILTAMARAFETRLRIRAATALDAERFLKVHRAAVRGLAADAYPAELIDDWAPQINAAALAAFRA